MNTEQTKKIYFYVCKLVTGSAINLFRIIVTEGDLPLDTQAQFNMDLLNGLTLVSLGPANVPGTQSKGIM